VNTDPKFQKPKGKATPPKSVKVPFPQADFHVPEVDTNFADNLFHDHAFADRFDASFSPTVPMGIASETPTPKTPKDDWNLLEFDFQAKPKP
jgi:hypothetical protein